MVRNKVFEENDKHIRKDMLLNKGDWERMTLSVSIYLNTSLLNMIQRRK